MIRRTSSRIFSAAVVSALALALAPLACGEFDVACDTGQNCPSDRPYCNAGLCEDFDDGAGGGPTGSTSATGPTGSTATGAGPQTCADDEACGEGAFCDPGSGLCAPCDTSDRCGPSCSPCGALAPCCVLGSCSPVGC